MQRGRSETLSQSFLSEITSSTLFFVIFAAGFLFLLVSFFLGEMFEGLGHLADFLHIDFHFDVAHDIGDAPSILSPRILSVFVTVFGGAGYVATVQFGFGLLASSALGAAFGMLFAGLTLLVVSWLYEQQATSTISPASLVGKRGTVSVAIPPNGFGQVVVNVVGARVTRSAKSVDGDSIPPNSTVSVVAVEGNGVVVRRI